MAIVQTKTKDSRYAHLEKLYTKDNIETDPNEDTVFDTEDTNDLLVSQQATITRKEILKNVGLFLLMGVLATCGYLLFRFV